MADADEQKSYGYGGKRPFWQWIALYVVIGLIIYGLIYYFYFSDKGGYITRPTGDNYNSIPTTGVTNEVSPTTNEKPNPTSASQESSNEITVEGNEFAFSPQNIKVKQGEEVKITFKNTGKFPHNYAITDLNVSTKTIQGGEEDTVTFTPSQKGTFNIICSVPGHADRGMKGTLTVE